MYQIDKYLKKKKKANLLEMELPKCPTTSIFITPFNLRTTTTKNLLELGDGGTHL